MEFRGFKTSYVLLAFSIIALIILVRFDQSRRENLKDLYDFLNNQAKNQDDVEVSVVKDEPYPLPQTQNNENQEREDAKKEEEKEELTMPMSSEEEEKLDEIEEEEAQEEALEEIIEEEHEKDLDKKEKKKLGIKTEDEDSDSEEFDCSSRIGEKGEFTVIPLVSLPGAGNTWVRFLIEQATGVVTGSVYSDGSLYRTLKGEMTNPINQETIAVKTHSVNRIRGKLSVVKDIKPKGCLLIIRSPRDAILAEYVRKNSHSHTGLVGDLRASLHSEAWATRSSNVARNFYKTYTGAVDYCDNEIGASHHLIVYEDLKESEQKLLEVMQNVTNYVNQANKEHFEKNNNHEKVRFRKECLEKNFEGNYHRKTGRDWDVAEYFAKEAKLAINANVERLNQTFNGKLPASYKIDLDEWPDRRRRSVENALEYFR